MKPYDECIPYVSNGFCNIMKSRHGKERWLLLLLINCVSDILHEEYPKNAFASFVCPVEPGPPQEGFSNRAP